MDPVIPYTAQLQADIPSLLAWNPALPTIAQTREAAINAIQQNFAAINAGAAPLPYLPLAGGATMSGLFNLAGNAVGNLQPVPYQQLVTYLAANNGVVTFNTRAGAVTLTSADIAAALGYTAANRAGDTFTGNVSVNGAVGPVSIAPQVRVINPASGALSFDYTQGFSNIVRLSAAASITAITPPPGGIMRISFGQTQWAITSWPANVVWPGGGAAPNLGTGALKVAVCVFFHDHVNGIIAGSSTVY